MEALLPFPKSMDEIPLDYDVFKKGDWRGPQARLMGLGYWLGFRIHKLWLGFAVVAVSSALIGLPLAFQWSLWFEVPLMLLGALLFVVYVLMRVFKIDQTCRNAWDNFIQQLDDDVYDVDGVISDEVRWHEGVHIWQKQSQAWGRHSTRYVGDPRGLPLPVLKKLQPYYRRHAECQAYAIEVVKGFDTLVNVAKSASKPIYALGMTEQEAFDLIGRYARGWEAVQSET